MLAARNAGAGGPAIGHRLASSPAIRSATLSSGWQPQSSFSVRLASLLSRPDLGGAEPPAATRSALSREQGENGEHHTFSAVSTVAHSSPVGGPSPSVYGRKHSSFVDRSSRYAIQAETISTLTEPMEVASPRDSPLVHGRVHSRKGHA